MAASCIFECIVLILITGRADILKYEKNMSQKKENRYFQFSAEYQFQSDMSNLLTWVRYV